MAHSLASLQHRPLFHSLSVPSSSLSLTAATGSKKAVSKHSFPAASARRLLSFHFQSPCSLPEPFSSSLRPRVSTAPIEQAPVPDADFRREIERLRRLRLRLGECPELERKLLVLDSDSKVCEFFSSSVVGVLDVLSSIGFGTYELYLLKCLVAAGQEHVLRSESWQGAFAFFYADDFVEDFRNLLRILRQIERFYDCIGGIIGYQIVLLELLSLSTETTNSWSSYMDESINCQFEEIYVPSGLDLAKDTEYASQAALWGIEGLPELGEIYPMGGSADRLDLVDPDTGECLPAAMLPYCGRTLLEGLIRDLQAREFLYFKLYGKQCITPVAIMTSSAKNNHQRIMALCERLGWFGRSQLNFKLFEQPLVPSVAAKDGQWVISRHLTPVCKPSGHGVIWKLAYDEGIFSWFAAHDRKAATVRQVSNVVAGTDLTLLALAGIGLRYGKKLGFASCERKFGATEGINVLVKRRKLDGKWAYGVTCVEYTEFEKFFGKDTPLSSSRLQKMFPANTNILYIDLASAEKVGSSGNASSLPGMVLNLKKPIIYRDHLGIPCSVSGGRLECTMQSIADYFFNTYSSRCFKNIEDALDTFIIYNERKRVTSSAKKKRRRMDRSLHQTPDGSLLDVLRNASDILSRCGISIPKIGDNSIYAESGPPFLILLHPALGPLWEVSRQKFQGGSLSEGSELQIEVAEFLWRNVQLVGSLIVIAENVMGSMKIHRNNEPILQYGHRCGRCKLHNVKVLNKGIDWNSAENIYWMNKVKRFETFKVILHGNAEFEATDVVLQGNHFIEVPDGYRLQVTSGNGGFSTKLEPLKEEVMDTGSWFWKYTLKGAHIHLEKIEL